MDQGEGDKPGDVADATAMDLVDAAAEGRQDAAQNGDRAEELPSLPSENTAVDSRGVSLAPVQNGCEPPLKRLDFAAERRLLPRVLPGAGVVTIQASPAELLPPGVEPRNQYCLDVAAARRSQRSGDKPRDRYPSCLPVLDAPVRNWAEFKRQVRAGRARGTQLPASNVQFILLGAEAAGTKSSRFSEACIY